MNNMQSLSDISKNKIYINSVLQNSSQFGIPIIAKLNQTFRIGGWPLDSSFAFDGELDEFAIYNYELSAEKVRRHYRASGN